MTTESLKKALNVRGSPIPCVVDKIPPGVLSQKTIKVKVSKRLYLSKYKRYYTKTYKRLVHYDSFDSPIEVGDKVLIYNCRRISAHKSAICYGRLE